MRLTYAGTSDVGRKRTHNEDAYLLLPEEQLYFDGEDTGTALAPCYGACDLTYDPWLNYQRFSRSLWCPQVLRNTGRGCTRSRPSQSPAPAPTLGPVRRRTS